MGFAIIAAEVMNLVCDRHLWIFQKIMVIASC